MKRCSDPLIFNTQLELENDYIESSVDPKLTLFDHSDGTPLHVALSLAREWFAEFLVTKGADVNAIARSGNSPLNLVTNFYIKSWSCQKMMALLLKGNASPNLPFLAETPLQSAIHGRTVNGANLDDIEVIRMLLDAGSDVNAVGNGEANIARIPY